ncbi:MAG: hypothetical protein Q9207_008428, partial [Kuettlingeria erythrocarpa]
KATCVYSKHVRDEPVKRQRQRSPEPDPDVSGNPVNQGRRRNTLASPSRGQQPSQFLQAGDQVENRLHATQTSSIRDQHRDQQQYVTSRSDANLDADSFMSDLDRVHFPPPNNPSLDDVLDNTDAIDLDFSRRNGTINSTAFSSLFPDVNLPMDGEDDNSDQALPMLPDFSASTITPISPAPQRPSIGLPRQMWSHQHNSSSGTASSSTGSPFQAFRAGYDDTSYSNQGLVSPTSLDSLFTPRATMTHQYPRLGDRSGERGQNQAGGSPPPRPTTSESCHCLEDIPALLSDLEYRRNDASASSNTLDSSLSHQRETLTRVSQLLSCPDCRSKSEFLALLSVVCEKSTALWETILLDRPSSQGGPSGAAAAMTPRSLEPSGSNGYKSNKRSDSSSSGGSSNSSNRPINHPNHPNNTTTNATFSPAHRPRTSSTSVRKVSLGAYEIHSPEEWHLLTNILLHRQLCQLYRLLKTIKALMVPLRHGTHFDALVTATEKRVKRLVERLGLSVGKMESGGRRREGLR